MRPASQNQLKLLRALSRDKGRAEHEAFLAEGKRLVGDALRAGHIPLCLLFEEDAATSDELRALASLAPDQARTAALKDFEAVSDTVTSQGVVAAFPKPNHSLADIVARPELTLLVLDQVRDPGNCGTMIRAAAAFDCDAALPLKGSCDPFNPKAVRASMGGVFHIPVFHLEPENLLALLREHKVHAFVLHNAVGAPSALTAAIPDRAAFIIGGETEGFSHPWATSGATALRIPQSPKIESLNAAAAANIALAWRYGRRAAGKDGDEGAIV